MARSPGLGLLDLRWGAGSRRVIVLDPKAVTLLDEPPEEPVVIGAPVLVVAS